MSKDDEATEIMDTLAGLIRPCPKCLSGAPNTYGRIPSKLNNGVIKFITCDLCEGRMKVREDVYELHGPHLPF